MSLDWDLIVLDQFLIWVLSLIIMGSFSAIGIKIQMDFVDGD